MSTKSPAIDPTQKVLLSFAEAGGLLDVSESKVYELVADGYLPVVEWGSVRKIARRDLDQISGLLVQQPRPARKYLSAVTERRKAR